MQGAMERDVEPTSCHYVEFLLFHDSFYGASVVAHGNDRWGGGHFFQQLLLAPWNCMVTPTVELPEDSRECNCENLFARMCFCGAKRMLFWEQSVRVAIFCLFE